MSTFYEEDPELEQLMRKASAEQGAPPDLRAKLRLMAAGAGARRPNRWPALIATTSVAAVAIVAFSISMAPTRSWSFERIVKAIDHQNSFQLSLNSGDGLPDHHVQIAVDDGHFVIRAGNAIVRFTGGKMEIYDPRENTVTDLSLGGIIDPQVLARQIDTGLAQGMKSIDIKKMIDDFAARYGKDNIRVSPIMDEYGKSFYEVDLQKPGEPERVHMVVNADNDLPEHIDISGALGPSENVSIDLQFGGEIDPSMANLQIPANAKHKDLDLGKMIQEGVKGHIDGGEIGKTVEEAMKHFGDPESVSHHGNDPVSISP
ncbi:MAG TPA: hypothetical protein VMI31_18960 [Fimbriimonadaceae bacterium]|nr:hypothetical protein [Fimbriimonadaceae bacterium]